MSYADNLKNSSGIDKETYEKIRVSEAKKYMARNKLNDILNKNIENKVYDQVKSTFQEFNLADAVTVANLTYTISQSETPTTDIHKLYSELAEAKSKAASDKSINFGDTAAEIVKKY